MKNKDKLEEIIRKDLEVRASDRTYNRMRGTIQHAHEPSKATTAVAKLSITRGMIMRSPITKLAAAAVIIAAIGFFIVHQRPSERADTTKASGVTKSPAEMMTTMSLRITHRRGGMEAVEEQYTKAFKLLGPRPGRLSVEQILAEFNGT